MRRLARRGISLTEVLVATFIMAVGLLSLASLMPVGLHEVAMATRAQRASLMGRAAWREIKIRQYLRPRSPIRQIATTAPQGQLWHYRTSNNPIDYTPAFVPTGDNPLLRGAFAIDPLFMASYAGHGNSTIFPYPTDPITAAVPANERVVRLTLSPSEYEMPLLNTTNGWLLARRLFTDQSEPTFAMTFPGMDTDIDPFTGARTDRGYRVYDGARTPQVDGKYSWMMTVSPARSDLGQLYTVSVVVFYDRPTPNPSGGTPVAPNAGDERSVNVVATSGTITRGDIQITWTPSTTLPPEQDFPLLKSNQWIMLYGRNNTTGFVEAKWYRIVALDDYRPDVAPGSRFLTIQGPDWDFTLFPNTRAGLFRNCVGVFEKTVKLEN